MAYRARVALKRFLAIQALSYVLAFIVILGQYVDLPSAILTPFTAVSVFLIPGLAMTWAIEGPALWEMSWIKVFVWSMLLSFGLNFPILFIMNETVGMIAWLIVLLELVGILGFSAVGYTREVRAQRGIGRAEPEPEAEYRCPNCGSSIRPEDDFCSNCGSAMGGPEDVGYEDALI